MRNHATCRGRRTDYFLRSPHFKILLTLHILIKVLNQLKQIVYMTHHNSINFYKVNFFMSSQCKLSCPPIHPSIHPSIFLSVIRGRVVGAAAWAGTPRLPSPRTLPPALPGGPQGVPRPAEWHSHTSVSWVFLGVSSRRDMPGTPPEGGVPRASETDARATSAGSSRRGEATALLRAPPGWQRSSPFRSRPKVHGHRWG